MERLEFKRLDELLGTVPEESGVYRFFGNSEILYQRISKNLRKSAERWLKSLQGTADYSRHNNELISRTAYFDFESTDNLFSALLKHKESLLEFTPEYNHIIREYDDYVYLGVSLYQAPYFKICENTVDELIFLGPFRSRFDVYDILDAFSDLLKMPNCTVLPVPCERVKTGKCKSYCMGQGSVKRNFSDEVFDVYLKVNERVIDKLDMEYKYLFNDLQFNRAHEMKQKISQLKRFYERLKFFLISKKMNTSFQDDKSVYEIEQGLIKSIYHKKHKKKIVFALDTVESYKDNEFLAYDKKEFDERLILYNYIVKGQGVTTSEDNKGKAEIMKILNSFMKQSISEFNKLREKHWRL